MLKLLLQLVLLIITAALVVLGLVSEVQKEEKDSWGNTRIKEVIAFKPNKKLFLAIIPLVLWIGTMCVVFVPANTVGIKYSAISGVSEDTLSEGLAFKTPFDKVYKIDTTVQEKAMSNLSVQTKDAQYVTMEINVKYSVNNSNAFKIFKSYKTLDNLQNNLIANATQRAVEEITTKYNVIELLGEQRSTIYIEIENALKERLSNEGVDLNFITIVDTSASDSIEKAIEQEAVAQKNVETARQKQEQAKIEAETKLIEARGEAEANAVKTKALTDEVLLEMWINKWNGVLPTVSGSEGTMIDISSLLGE